jgi:hypothetical protein
MNSKQTKATKKITQRPRLFFLTRMEEVRAQTARELEGKNLSQAATEIPLQGCLPSVEKIEKELDYGG